VNCGINPSPTLGKQNTPRFRSNSTSNSIRDELGLESWEVFHQESGQETIFTEREKILLVKGVNVGLGVLVDNTIRDDDWTAFVSSSNAVEGETSRETGD
jgi:hypothetical protein